MADEPIEVPVETDETQSGQPVETPPVEVTEPTIETEFEQITWDEWINNYWIETISMFPPRVFVRVSAYSHKGKNERRPIRKYETMLTTAYVPGEDGFTYIKTLVLGEIVLEPIYKTRKGI
jgi:hypothetical protein